MPPPLFISTSERNDVNNDSWVNVSLELLHHLLQLPDDIKIARVVDEEEMPFAFRMYIEGDIPVGLLVAEKSEDGDWVFKT